MTYAGLELSEIRRRMDERYAKASPYEAMLPFDSDRHLRICRTLLALALSKNPRDAMERSLAVVGTRTREPGLTLDVGCGENGAADFWPDGTSIVGLDISAEAIKKVSSKFPHHEYHTCAAEEFDDQRRFDTVIAVESIEHWADAGRGLAMVKKHLAPGGRFVLSTPNADALHLRIGRKLGWKMPFCSQDHVHEFGFDELVSLLTESGFSVIASKGVYLTPYWALEGEFGRRVRALTDADLEVVRWLAELGEAAPPEYSFIQCHACELK